MRTSQNEGPVEEARELGLGLRSEVSQMAKRMTYIRRKFTVCTDSKVLVSRQINSNHYNRGEYSKRQQNQILQNYHI